MRHRLTPVFVALLLPVSVPVLATVQAEAGRSAIEDNSFFIEEAYNQDVGVLQHINAMALSGPSHRDLFYSFTQEWPFRGQGHQLSYTIQVARLAGQSAGFGDIFLNYRQQFGGGEAAWAFAPRLSVILPTGSVSRGLGDGTLGMQVNLPLSYHLTRSLVSHWNAGLTFLPSAQGSASGGKRPRRSLTNFNLGGSLIAPTNLPVQFMLESVVNFESEIGPGGSVDLSTTWILSPGLRAAMNLGSLQIVPGIAFPFTRSGGDTVHDLFLYLSFEHPFAHSSD
jgi:hypothetical protein